ncbi:MAG: hypothetical protein AAFN93_21025 [Bacteroidota bacterium]
MKNIINIFSITILATALLSCGSSKKLIPMKYPFRPIEPIDYLGDVPQFNASSKQIERFTLLSLTDSDRLEFLTNEEVHMTMQQLDME